MHITKRFAPLLSLPLLMLPEAPLPAQETVHRAAPPGAAKSTKTRLLETGAWALQSDAPTDLLNIHLVGFHPSKANPAHQMEAHHYCRQVERGIRAVRAVRWERARCQLERHRIHHLGATVQPTAGGRKEVLASACSTGHARGGGGRGREWRSVIHPRVPMTAASEASPASPDARFINSR